MDFVRDKRVKDALMNSTIQNMFPGAQHGGVIADHGLSNFAGGGAVFGAAHRSLAPKRLGVGCGGPGAGHCGCGSF